MPQVRRLAVLACCIGLVGVCGCASTTIGQASKASSGSPSPASPGLTPLTVMDTARAEVAQHSSVHVTGTASTGASPMVLDLHLLRGHGGSASLHDASVTVDFVRLGTDLWVRGNAAFWTQTASPAVAARVGHTWAHTTVAAESPVFGGFTDYSAFLDNVLSTSGSLTSAPGVTLGGVATVAVRDASAPARVIYVQADGPPLVLRVIHDGTLDMSGWDMPVDITPPSGPDVVELDAAP